MPFIFCVYFLRKNKSKDLKVFFVSTISLFISIITVITFRYVFKSYTAYLIFLRFFIVLEFALISFYFTYHILNPIANKIIRYLLIPFLLFSIYDYLSSIDKAFTYYPLVLECLILPIIILVFFYERMKHSTKYPIYSSPAFWIAVAFLIFSTGNFFLFLFSKMLIQDLNSKLLYNNIYGFFAISKNVLLCIGIIVAKNYKGDDERPDINTTLELDTFIPFNKK